jgi:hypothetical protein
MAADGKGDGVTAEQGKSATTPPVTGRSPVLRLAVTALVVGAITMLLRAAPVFDADVQELWGRLNAVHQQVLAAREKPQEWRAFTESASSELKQIADDARRSLQRLQGPWRWIGVDRRDDAALREVQRMAESDLPALLASGTKGHALRDKNVAEAFARIDDHLAGASPYLPPMRPIENQDGMDRNTGVKQSWPGWLVAVVVVDCMLLAGGVWWWVRRSQRGKSTIPTAA